MISRDIFLRQILPVTLKHEGGWVNHPLDRGGETYRGISRGANPNWPGWRLIDAAKPLTRGATVLAAEPLVKDFYYNSIFRARRFNEVNSVQVASALFDFAVHGGYTVRGLQTILNNQFGENLRVDGLIGPLTLAAVNRANPARLTRVVMEWRGNHINRILSSNPSQQVFANGWNNRLNSFSNILGVVKDNPGKTSVAVLITLALLWFMFFRNKQQLINPAKGVKL